MATASPVSSISETSPKQTGPAPLDASRLHIERIKQPRPVGWLETPPTGIQSEGTDHMLQARWTTEHGWAAPEIVPYTNLSIPPTAPCLHYATQCFEGMKVYRGYDGRIRMFRPQANFARLLRSAARVSLPAFDPIALETLLARLLSLDCPRWLPADLCKGQALYVRPALIANGPTIGVRLPGEALLFVIAVPWLEIDPSLVKQGLHLLASQDNSIRAWPGGFGDTKIGANYGPSFVSFGEARARGFDQVLWLFGPSGIVTEAGASNFFVVWRTREGRLQLVTPPLVQSIILPGITRHSVLCLARERLQSSAGGAAALAPLEVVEDEFAIADIVEAEQQGRLVEAFVSGTAYFITPVSRIQWRGQDIQVPMPVNTGVSYAQTLRGWLQDIMYGVVEHHWAVTVDEDASINV